MPAIFLPSKRSSPTQVKPSDPVGTRRVGSFSFRLSGCGDSISDACSAFLRPTPKVTEERRRCGECASRCGAERSFGGLTGWAFVSSRSMPWPGTSGSHEPMLATPRVKTRQKNGGRKMASHLFALNLSAFLSPRSVRVIIVQSKTNTSRRGLHSFGLSFRADRIPCPCSALLCPTPKPAARQRWRVEVWQTNRAMPGSLRCMVGLLCLHSS